MWGGKRRFQKKRGGRKSVAGKRRAGKVRANYNNSQLKMDGKINGSLFVTQGVTVTNYSYFDVCALTGNTSALLTREYQVYSKLFDQFRITGVTLNIKPRMNVQTLTDSYVPHPGDSQTVFSAFDVDSPIPSNLAAIQTMKSARKHSILKQFTRTFKYKYNDNSWLDTSGNYSTVLSNWLSKGLYAHFGLYGENMLFSSNTPWCEFQLIYHFVFRGPKAMNVSKDDLGNIILGEPEPEMKPLSSIELTTVLKPISDDNEADDA